MPLCPSCKTNQSKRTQGACPECGEPVELFNGRWYRTSVGTPTVSLVEEFERLVTAKQSAGRKVPVVFRFPRKASGYRTELSQAEILLDLADGDYDLALHALNLLFTEDQFRWKSHVSLLYLKKDFLLALAISRSERKASEQEAQRNTRVIDRLMEQEDIFS